MKRYIKASSDDTIYVVTEKTTSTDRNGWVYDSKPWIYQGTLDEQIEALKSRYEHWSDYYRKLYGRDLDFSKINTIEKVLTGYRQIDKAQKAKNPEMFTSKKKYSARTL